MEQKKVKKITKGKVIRRKKKPTTGLEQSMKTAWDYIKDEVLIPALRDTAFDAVTTGAQSIFYQGVDNVSTRHAGRTRGVIGNHKTNYNEVSARRGINRPEPERRVSVSRTQVDDIVVSSRSEADQIIDTLKAEIEQYDVATISSLYSMVGITPTFTDEKWGWYDLRGAAPKRVRDGFLLILPEPEALL